MKIFIYFLLSLHVAFGLKLDRDGTATDPPVGIAEPSASAGGSETPSDNSTEAANTADGEASSTDNVEPQHLFTTAATALIEQAKTKLDRVIEITLKDTVVTAITSAPTSVPGFALLTKRKTKPQPTVESLTHQSDRKRNKNRRKPPKNSRISVEKETREHLDDSKLIDEGATAKITTDDAKSVVEESDKQQRSSRKRNSERRKHSSKATGTERQNLPSNAAMVGVNEIAVSEVSFKKSNGPRNKGTVTINSVIGPIKVMLTSNSSEIPVASFSLGAAIAIRIGQGNAPAQLQDIRSKHLRILDLNVDDALIIHEDIIRDEVKRKIIGAGFDQLLKGALGASLKDENVNNAFVAASRVYVLKVRAG